MTIIFIDPAVGAPCGPGFQFTIQFSVLPPAGSSVRSTLWVGSTFANVQGTTGAGSTNQVTGVLGFVYPVTPPPSPQMFPGLSIAPHGTAGRLQIDVFPPAGGTFDTGSQNVTFDFITGIAYLITVFRGTGGSSGAGFTDADRQLLNNVYAAVHHVYPPS